MKLYQSIVNMKMNALTASDLLKYAKVFSVSLTESQAASISQFVRGKGFNLFDPNHRSQIKREIQARAGVQAADSFDHVIDSIIDLSG